MVKTHYVYSGLGFWPKGTSLSGNTGLEWIEKLPEIARKMADDNGRVMLYVFRNTSGKGPEYQLFFGHTNASKVDTKGWLDKKKEEVQ